VAAVYAVAARMLPPPFAVAAALSLLSHWLGFGFSVLIGSNFLFDVTEDIAYAAIFAWIYASIEGEPSLRQRIVFALAGLWIARLLAFLGYRIIMRGSDFRFSKLITEPCYNLFGWTSGGTWCFINGFCLWHLAGVPADVAVAPLDILDAVGVATFCGGLLLEIVADVQKYQFNRAFAAGANTQWIATGVWKVSRHPNYCGEVTLWLGLSLVSIGGLSNLRAIDVGLCLVTPLWSLLFLTFTSLMLLEKAADKKWGRLKAYKAYKQRTPVLFPGLS
jgi:steroid 5-alpha reductase family enzyme